MLSLARSTTAIASPLLVPVFFASVIPAWGKLLNELAARSSAAADVAKHVGRLVQKGSAHAFDEAAQVLPAFDRGDDDGALYGILFRGCLSE
jgi:hypothetical protein